MYRFIQDSSSFCTYKYPLQSNEKSVQRQSQRAKSRVLGFLLSCSLGFLFFFSFYVSEGEGYVESDTDVCFSSLPLYQVIKVIFFFCSLFLCFIFLFVFSSFSLWSLLVVDEHASDFRSTSITSFSESQRYFMEMFSSSRCVSIHACKSWWSNANRGLRSILCLMRSCLQSKVESVKIS